MWRACERLQIDRPCDSIHAWVPSDRGESLCPVAKKPISENGESDQALASIASENFGLSPGRESRPRGATAQICPDRPTTSADFEIWWLAVISAAHRDCRLQK